MDDGDHELDERRNGLDHRLGRGRQDDLDVFDNGALVVDEDLHEVDEGLTDSRTHGGHPLDESVDGVQECLDAFGSCGRQVGDSIDQVGYTISGQADTVADHQYGTAQSDQPDGGPLGDVTDDHECAKSRGHDSNTLACGPPVHLAQSTHDRDEHCQSQYGDHETRSAAEASSTQARNAD